MEHQNDWWSESRVSELSQVVVSFPPISFSPYEAWPGLPMCTVPVRHREVPHVTGNPFDATSPQPDSSVKVNLRQERAALVN